jgi:hypothetical protein
MTKLSIDEPYSSSRMSEFSSSMNEMSPFKIETIINSAAGSVKIPSKGKIMVKPVIRPIDE